MALRPIAPAARVGPTLCFNLRPRSPRHPQVLRSTPKSRNISTTPVPEVEATKLDVATSKRDAFDAQIPLVIRSSPTSQSITYLAGRQALNTAYRKGLPVDVDLPYELVGTRDQVRHFREKLKSVIKWREQHPGSQNGGGDGFTTRLLRLQDQLTLEPKPPDDGAGEGIFFLRFMAPFELVVGLEYNFRLLRNRKEPGSILCLPGLYIAQADLNHLSQQIPIPDYVAQAGNGDIYKSSFWMGLEPTYTPWHRDPNPNYFLQMKRLKIVRLLPPNRGRQLFNEAMAKLPPVEQSSSRIRGEEMMQQAQRDALTDAVWGAGAPEGILETVLKPGDALFIPQGWWHSLRGGKKRALKQLNLSFNWWFR